MQSDLNSIAEQNLTQQPKSWKVLLIGDAAVDVYNFGTINRLSPEAPVPVFITENTVTLDGMAKNVGNNLKSLGCKVTGFFGVPSTKTRFIDSRSKQHIMRLDDDRDPEGQFNAEIFDMSEYDAVVISDYDKGYVGYKTILDIVNYFSGPIFIDTKKIDLTAFDREDVYVKINLHEYNSLVGYCKNIITTLGKEGARYKDHVYQAPQVEVADVCGAGDTFLAALAYEYLNTDDINKAIQFANRAASVTVKHIGVYAPKLEEINAA